MPIHDYHCPKCAATFELFVRSSTDAICPQCGNAELEKQLSTPAAPGKSKQIIAASRQQAAKEGHMSHFSAKERKQLLR